MRLIKMPPGQHQRFAADRAAKFQKRDDRAGKRDRTDADADKDLAECRFFSPPSSCACGPEIGRKPNQHRRQPDKAVQYRHQLRHRRHLHTAARIAPITEPRNQRRRQHRQPADVHRRRRRDKRDQHSDNAVPVPAPGRLLPDSPPRLKINNALAAMYAIVIRLCCIKWIADILVRSKIKTRHGVRDPKILLPKHPNMRFVTKNPPAILIAAIRTAIAPRITVRFSRTN